jgi:hypothetical protein
MSDAACSDQGIEHFLGHYLSEAQIRPVVADDW